MIIKSALDHLSKITGTGRCLPAKVVKSLSTQAVEKNQSFGVGVIFGRERASIRPLEGSISGLQSSGWIPKSLDPSSKSANDLCSKVSVFCRLTGHIRLQCTE